MIFKIVTHIEDKGVSNKYGDTRGLVVPHEDWIFEAPKAKYKKLRMLSWKEFKRYCTNWDSFQLIGSGPECACKPDGEECDKCRFQFGVSKGCTPSDQDYVGREFIELVLCGPEAIVGVVMITEGDLFIMNGNGKTIDSIHLPK